MGYYFIDDEDGYIREFDAKRNFIPNEHVAAFAPGPGFDWSQLKTTGEQAESDTAGGSAKQGGTAKARSSEIPGWVRRAAERYADDNRQKALSQGRGEITADAGNQAREAYVSYRKEDRLIPKDMAGSGVYSGSGRESGKAYARYMQAMGIIQGNMEKLLAKLDQSAASQEEKDVKEYIARWKQDRV